MLAKEKMGKMGWQLDCHAAAMAFGGTFFQMKPGFKEGYILALGEARKVESPQEIPSILPGENETRPEFREGANEGYEAGRKFAQRQYRRRKK